MVSIILSRFYVIVDASDSDFSAGQKVACLMGGMGRSFHGGYAEYALLPVHHVFPVQSSLSWVELGAVPESRHQNSKVLFLELAVGYNTPGIIKYSFWRMTHEWKDATYICLNYGEAYAPDEIKKNSVCINGDIGEILAKL